MSAAFLSLLLPLQSVFHTTERSFPTQTEQCHALLKTLQWYPQLLVLSPESLRWSRVLPGLILPFLISHHTLCPLHSSLRALNSNLPWEEHSLCTCRDLCIEHSLHVAPAVFWPQAPRPPRAGVLVISSPCTPCFPFRALLQFEM